MSRSGSLLMKLAEWWRELYRSRVAVEEIDRIGAGLIAHDVGLCPADLHNLAAKRSDATDLLCVHLAVLGIDQEELARTNPAVLRDLERVCTLCDSKRLCARDLADAPLYRRWREYCPNVLTIDALVAERGRSPKNVNTGGGLPSYEVRAAKTRSHR
jgi:hypothetical protein